MAEDLKLRQRATQQLIAQTREDLSGFSDIELERLSLIATEFEAELNKQGVSLYAAEAFAVLTFIEGLDAESTDSIGDLQKFISAMRSSLRLKVRDAWDRRDKDFFTN